VFNQTQPYPHSVVGRSYRQAPLNADALTGREVEVLQLVVGGASNREIASRTGVTENTIKFHLKNVYSKLDVSSRTGAVKAAVQLGLVQF
jgi:ATP/maltotriose-dependent transcriptional regulator MalT